MDPETQRILTTIAESTGKPPAPKRRRWAPILADITLYILIAFLCVRIALEVFYAR